MRLALGLLTLPLLVAVAVLIAASGFGSPPLATDFGVVFPKHGGLSSAPSEDVGGGGVLVLDDVGCLRLGRGRGPDADDGSTGTVPIWPRDFDLVLEGGKVLIVDTEGEEVARVGDKVEVNGAPMEEVSPQQELVERCPGYYFRVGNAVRIIRRQGVPVVANGDASYDLVGKAKETRENNQYWNPKDQDSKARAKLKKTEQRENKDRLRQYQDRLR